MDGFELPMRGDQRPSTEWVLSVHLDDQARLLGGSEAWYQVTLLDSGKQKYDGATASQPLSCFRAVAEGRKTAMMCKEGILALRLSGDDVVVECLTAEAALSQAPAVEEQRFRVPRILAED